MSDDLTAACGPLGLISPAGVCNSLRARLDATASAIAKRNLQAASGSVGALLRELDAQRGKQVSEPAYAVLQALGLLLQAQFSR